MTPNATYQLNVKTTPRRRICNPLEDDGGGTGRESGDILSIKHCYESAGILRGNWENGNQLEMRNFVITFTAGRVIRLRFLYLSDRTYRHLSYLDEATAMLTKRDH